MNTSPYEVRRRTRGYLSFSFFINVQMISDTQFSPIAMIQCHAACLAGPTLRTDESPSTYTIALFGIAFFSKSAYKGGLSTMHKNLLLVVINIYASVH